MDDELSKSNQLLSSGRRVAIIAFVAVAMLVGLAFLLTFWLAILFVDDPIPWILGLVIVGGLLGVAQATFLWPLIVDLCAWSIDNEPMRRIRSQFPAIETAICAAPKFALRVRCLIMLQSVVQILGACIVAFFI